MIVSLQLTFDYSVVFRTKDSEKESATLFCTSLPRKELSSDSDHGIKESPYLEISNDNDKKSKHHVTMTKKAYMRNILQHQFHSLTLFF